MFKKVIATLLAVTVSASLMACGSAKPDDGGAQSNTNNTEEKTAETAEETIEDSGQKANNGSKKVVKVAVTANSLNWMQPIIDNYLSTQDVYDIEVIEVPSSSDMYTKMTMMMQSPKICPDIMMEDGFMINADAAAGRLMPLDEALSEWADLEQFVPAILEGARGEDGNLYGLPISTDTQGIYYDKKVFEAAGITTPWQPKNWDEILDTAKKLKSANAEKEDFIPVFMYSSKSTPEETSMRTFQVLMSGAGGTLYDREAKKWVVDSDNLQKVFEFINNIYNVEKVGQEPSFSAQPKVGDLLVSDYMQNEKLGMYFTGSWTMGSFAENARFPWAKAQEVWDFANIPTYDGTAPGFTTMSGGWTYAIPANANEKDGAIDFLKVLAGKEGELAYTLYTGDLAVRKDIMTESAYIDKPMSSVREATAQLEFAHFRPSVDGYSSLTSMFTAVVESIAIGSATPQKALETFKTEMIRMVGEDKVLIK